MTDPSDMPEITTEQMDRAIPANVRRRIMAGQIEQAQPFPSLIA